MYQMTPPQPPKPPKKKLNILQLLILLAAFGFEGDTLSELVDNAVEKAQQAGETLLWPEYPLLSQTPGMDELLDGVDAETEWSYYTQPIIPDAI